MGKLKLVPLSKTMAKKLGVVQTKNGLMYDTSKVVDKKKYQSKDKVSPREPKLKPQERLNKQDEAKGLY